MAHPTSVASLRNSIMCRALYWIYTQKSCLKADQKSYIKMQFKAAQSLEPSDAFTANMFFDAVNHYDVEMAEDILLDYLETQNSLDPPIKRAYLNFLYTHGANDEAKNFKNLRLAFKQKVREAAKNSNNNATTSDTPC